MSADPIAALEQLDAAQLRALVAEQATQLAHLSRELGHKDVDLRASKLKIEQLSHEIAMLRRWKFAAKSEQLTGEQRSLFDDDIDADIEAIECELKQLLPAEPTEREKARPKRARLPAELARTEIRHEPASTTCACGCALRRIGEDVAERLDYRPGIFTVERHIRGKWVCAACESIAMAPMPAQIIDKGLPTAGLLAQVLVAKYADHAPLYRQEAIFGRAGLALPRSTLAAWVGAAGVALAPVAAALKTAILQHRVLHADETPVAMLKPGAGKTHRAYLWAYCAGAFEPMRAVVYDFAESRSGQHARDFLGTWRGALVCDDFSGYKALFERGVTELGCLAHARRKFFDLHAANKSQIAAEALAYFGQLYAIERQAARLPAPQRLAIRQSQARAVADALHAWLALQRSRVADGSATAKALDYSLKRWAALTRYLDDADAPADNNWCENQIRPIALGRSNWLFAGSLRAGQRAAAVMSLIQSARMNGLDPYAYLKDVLGRLPTQPAARVDELLPHRWQPTKARA